MEQAAGLLLQCMSHFSHENRSDSVIIIRMKFGILMSMISFTTVLNAADRLPFDVVFKGQDRFNAIVARAQPQLATLRALPIGERTAWFGQLLVGTPYKGFTLEIDDRIEAASCNLNGLDCWTFFETALALGRMCDLPADRWNPAQMLSYIEQDRYWKGKCTGSYLSRLHYLEHWAQDNDHRGLVEDLTRKLGGIGVPNAAREMTQNADGYRYMVNSPTNRAAIARLEADLRKEPLYMIPKSKVPGIESKLQNGDIIGIISKDGPAYGTSHVGIALRKGGTLHFMHASAPRNYGKVVIDSRLSDYLERYMSNAGILVARPLK